MKTYQIIIICPGGYSKELKLTGYLTGNSYGYYTMITEDNKEHYFPIPLTIIEEI